MEGTSQPPPGWHRPVWRGTAVVERRYVVGRDSYRSSDTDGRTGLSGWTSRGDARPENERPSLD